MNHSQNPQARTGIITASRIGLAASWLGALLLGTSLEEAEAQTPVSGSISSDTTWTLANSPYQVTGSITVNAGVTLTIEAGVQVVVSRYQGLHVDGSLRALGTAGAPITFTGTTETANWWNGIVVRNTGSATLEHARVRHTGYANNAGLLKLGTGDLALRRTAFEHNSGAGLYLQPGFGNLVFEQNSFAHNTHGVQVGVNASFLDDDATTYSHNGADVYVNGGTLTTDTRWYLNPAYSLFVGGQVTVATGVELTILPGTVLKFAQYQGLTIDGTLAAIGTAARPIHFTDWRDDTAGGDANGDGAATLPTPNWWNGLVVRNTGSATLEHARVRYTGYANNAGLLKMGTGNLTLRRTSFEQNGGAALYLQPGYANLVFEQNSFAHNTRGVQVGLNASFLDDDATTYSHNGADVHVNGGTLTTHTRWYLNPAYSLFIGAHLTVGPEARLQILPGTVVKFAQYQGLAVDGTLEAVGTAMAPIHFTDWRDDSAGGDANGDGDATLPTPNWWSGIVVRNAGSATFEHARLGHAGYANNAGLVRTGTGDLALRRTNFEHNGGAGLYLQPGYGDLVFEQNSFSHNTHGVQVGVNASFLDDDATAYSHNGADVHVNGGTLTTDTRYYLNPAYSLLIGSHLTIGPEARLQFLPGTVVKVARYQGLTVDGALEASGTTARPIYFTDWRDDSAGGDANGDGDATLPAPNWWSGIVVRNAGYATFEHARVRYAGYANNAGLVKTGTGDLALRRTAFEQNSGAGLYLQPGYANLVFEQNSFAHNTRGVQVGVNASFLDDDATTYSQNGADVYVNGGTLATHTRYYLNPAYSLLISSYLTIGPEARLQILPGTVVKFAQYQGLAVDGTLEAIGTAMAPIHFTDWRDDSAGGDANGDGDATLPTPNWWSGIVVRNAGSATFEHGRLGYAGYANNAGLVKTGTGHLTLRRSAIGQTMGDGLRLDDSRGVHSLERNTLTGNTVGVQVRSQTQTIFLTANLIQDNTDFGVRNQNSVEIDARGNWWGHASGPRHAALNPEGQGDAVNDGVLFDPWRTTPSAGEILSPVRSGTLVVGDLLRFSGSLLTEPGATYRWSFSDGRAYSTREPGLLNFPHTGTVTVAYSATADGSEDPHPDTRTYSVAANPGNLPDLRVAHVRVAGTLAVGQTARIDYTVRNAGQGSAHAGWRDAVYLSRDPYLDLEDVYLGSAVIDQDLLAGQSYQGALHVTLPPVEEGAYHLILAVNDEWQFVELHRLNNEFASPITAEVPTLTTGVTHSVLYEAGRVEHHFRMTATAGRNLLLDLTGVPQGLEVFIRFDALPTRGLYDHLVRGGERFVIPAAAPGHWYLMLYGDIDQAGEYTLRFALEDLVLIRSTPPRHGTSTDLELTLTGAGFLRPLGVTLVSSQGESHPAAHVEVDSFTQATATFAAGAVPAGSYAIRVSHAAHAVELAGALDLIAGGTGKLDVQLILPARFGYHILATVFVEYANTGDTAMAAPLLLVTATQNGRPGAILTLDQTRLSSGFWTSAMPEGFANSVQFMAAGETPGILQPGESRRVPVYYAGWQKPWDFSYPPFEWQVGVLDAENTTPVDWAALKPQLRPPYIREDAWDVVWNNFTALAGPTWGDYVTMLSRNASHLQRQGLHVEDIDTLLAFSVRQADGLSPLSVLASGVDAVARAPGWPILFERAYLQPLSRRFELGPLGRGWTHNWQYSLSLREDGTVTITDRTGTPRIFHPDNRFPGRYLAQPGDQSTLRSVPEGFRLTEVTGTVQLYDARGRLIHMEDNNGNGITCEYTDGRLTRLAHSSNASLEIAYNAAGRVASVTDPHGRQTRFSYEGEHLTSVSTFDGLSTTYSYNANPGPAQHALNGITLPDGTRRAFRYDEHGRLAGTHRDNQAEAIVLTHPGEGCVHMTDALGHTTRFLFDFRGQIVRTENALGEAVRSSFDDLGNLTTVTDPDGLTSTFAYDRTGNLVEISDALRRTTRFTYTRASGRLATVTDALDNRTTYTYDPRGNLVSLTHPDSSAEHWTYDTQGNPVSWTNRRRNLIRYHYDHAGRIAGKSYADGSEVAYSYDARGNLVEAVDSQGTHTFTYNAVDYLTRIDYPGGRYLAFTYDSAGRRASSEDQLGHRVHYHYDDAGRLSRLSGDDGDLVTYSYDAVGRLERQTLGNGVYTTHAYDPAGRLQSLVNRQPNGQILSSYAHTYDRRGRRTAMQTHYGQWSYEYDDAGQITRAVLTSNDPAEIPNQELVYEYDALGNRTRTTVNGATQTYDINLLNQYVQAGDRAYTYDADGNLIREEGPGGVTVYSYNDENQLTGVARGGDQWEYLYDALGHRIASIENGILTQYVVDPIGIGNLAGEYNAGGDLLARYTHGFGLVSRNADYYTFDPVGNVSELTGPSGILQNAYVYRPFGETLRHVETAPNPFRFMGQFGIMADPTGLDYVRARFYEAGLGRFTGMDPIGLFGNDVNPYRYAFNNPNSFVDPEGEAAVLPIVAVGLTVYGLYSLGSSLWDWWLELERLEAINRERAEAHRDIARGRPGAVERVNRLNSARDAQTLCTLKQGFDTGIQIVKTPVTGVSYSPDDAVKDIATRGTRFCGPNRQPVQPPPACQMTPGGSSGRQGQPFDRPIQLHSATSCMPFTPVIHGDSGLAAAHDPNEKTALGGYGARNFLALGSLLRYQIDFENLETATAPAQIVTIRDPLPPDLDLTTFEIAEVGFGEIIVPVGQGRRYFEAVIDYPYTDDDYDFFVVVHVEAWLEDGVFHANFITLDPDTGLPPQDVGIGFLPPENETGRGQGYVAYTIRPRDSLSTGATIRNIATLQFDFGLEIDTNQVDPLDKTKGTDPDKEALVTIDIVPPTSRVDGLPVESPSQFTVSWSGHDDASGVRAYDVYVSRGGAAYEPWHLSTRATSALFTGDNGQTYQFYSVATDNAGNQEMKSPAAEAMTTVSLPPPLLRIVEAGWEGDSFIVRVPTESDRTYHLEHSDVIDGSLWLESDAISGDGTVRTLVDPDPPASTRFYRIRMD